MTGSDGRGDAPLGRPWSVDTLADLHAGVLDDAVAAALWPQVDADPRARAVIDALEATRSDLCGLAGLPVPMPADVAARIDTALTAERAGHTVPPTVPPTVPTATQQRPLPQPARPPRPAQSRSAPVADLAAARKRRNTMVGWATGVVTAAAAVVGITVALSPGGAEQASSGSLAGGDRNTEAPPAGGNGSGPLALGSGDELNGSVLRNAMHAEDYGPLADRARRTGCLSAHGDIPASSVVGARQVTMDGRNGVLFVLTTGKPARFRLLAVGANCSKDNPATLGDKTVG